MVVVHRSGLFASQLGIGFMPSFPRLFWRTKQMHNYILGRPDCLCSQWGQTKQGRAMPYSHGKVHLLYIAMGTVHLLYYKELLDRIVPLVEISVAFKHFLMIWTWCLNSPLSVWSQSKMFHMNKCKFLKLSPSMLSFHFTHSISILM